MKRFLLAAVCGAMLLASTAQTQAAVLYGTSHRNAETTSTSHLYLIDPVTGVTTAIGDTGFSINGLDYYNGTLYAIDGAGGSLLSLNTTTGAATVIAPLSGVGFTRPTGLTIHSSGAAYTWIDPSSDDLATLDLNTGAWSIVGDAGIGTAEHGYAFIGNTLYLVNFDGSVYTVDTTTGAATILGGIGVSAHHGDVNPDNGLYYGLDGLGGTDDMYLVNLTAPSLSGLVTLDRNIMHALAFVDGSVVPEPGSLTLLSLGALGAVGYARRRRQSA